MLGAETRLIFLEFCLEELIDREVCCTMSTCDTDIALVGARTRLICSLPQGSKGNTSVEGTNAFFFDHEICGMRGVAVFGHIERI